MICFKFTEYVKKKTASVVVEGEDTSKLILVLIKMMNTTKETMNDTQS
jgi:hypothetical protein